MPAEKILLPDLSDEENIVLNRLLAGLNARRPNNLRRLGYYESKRLVRMLGTVIPPQYRNLAICLGWSAKAVDILARRCNLDGFVWADGDLDGLGAARVWDDNFLSTEFSSASISSLIHGVSYLITTEGDPEAGEPKALIHAKDALNAFGEWNSRSRRLDNLLSVTDRDSKGKISSFALYLENKTITAYREGGSWELDDEPSEHGWGVPAEPLVYKPRTGRKMGQSRISRPVMALNDSAVRTLIRLEGHMDIYSFPEFVLLGASLKDFKNADGSSKDAWQVMLGRWKALPDDEGATTPRADVKQFAASDPKPHLDTFRQQAEAFSGETSIPLSSLGVSHIGNPTSADSYIASREDLISEAEGATDDWSPALRRTFARALAIYNDEKSVPESFASIDAKFRSPVHLSRAAEADAGSKQLAAAPWLAETTVGLELLGLSEQQISRAMSERRQTQGRATVAALAALAPSEA